MQVSGNEGNEGNNNLDKTDDQQNSDLPNLNLPGGNDAEGNQQGSNDQSGTPDSATADLTPKMLSKAAALVGKTLLLTTSSTSIEAELREAIKKAKQGQLQASQRELEGESSPEGEDVESWVKLVRKLNNKLDKHMNANESLSKSLEDHAALYRQYADQLVELSKAYD